MSEHFDQTLAAFREEIDRMEEELSQRKRAANVVCGMAKVPPLYPDAEKPVQGSIGSIRRDQWYGQPVSTAIREYLTMRRALNQGPATVNEIYEALVSGGFSFEARDAENCKRGLRISLTKNTAIFHRLPDGSHFGLLDWYPEAKSRKAREEEVHEEEEEGEETAVDAVDAAETGLPLPSMQGAMEEQVARRRGRRARTEGESNRERL